MRAPAEAPLLLYDEDCGFCRWMLGWVLRWDRARMLRVAPIQSPHGDRLLAAMSEEERLASWHLALPDGRLRSGGAVFSALGPILPGAGPLGRLAGRFSRLSQAGYRAVATRRSVWGRLVRERSKRAADEVIAQRRVQDQAVPASPAGSDAGPARP